MQNRGMGIEVSVGKGVDEGEKREGSGGKGVDKGEKREGREKGWG